MLNFVSKIKYLQVVRMLSLKRAVTLMELIIAVSLLGVILVTGAAIDITARRFFNVSDRQAELQNEVNPVLLRIKRDINRAIGVITDSGIVIGGGGSIIALRVDNNVTPGNLADDTWMVYQWTANQIRRYIDPAPLALPPAGAFDVIGNRITAFTATSTAGAFGGSVGAIINITARFNPAAVVGVDNPELILRIGSNSISQSAR